MVVIDFGVITMGLLGYICDFDAPIYDWHEPCCFPKKSHQKADFCARFCDFRVNTTFDCIDAASAVAGAASMQPAAVAGAALMQPSPRMG